MMVKVKGPMMSIDASGTLAGTFVFSKWKGRNTVRSHAVPANPKTAAQTSTRAMMKFLSQSWTNLSTAQKATFDALAATYAISPFNAFVKYNMARWTQFTAPQIEIGSSAGTAPTLGALSVTAGVGELTVSQAITIANDMWGILFAASTSTGFTPAKTDLRLAVYGTTDPVAGVLTNLAAGTWYIRTAGFAADGTKSAWLAEVSGVVS